MAALQAVSHWFESDISHWRVNLQYTNIIVMNYPIVINDVLPVKLFNTLIEDFESNWSFGVQSKENPNAPKFWYREETNTLLHFECSSYIKLKIKKSLKRDIRLIRIYGNGQTPFQSNEFHIDFEEDDFWTFVLFTTPFWNTNWSGELIIRNEQIKNYSYIPYFPNRGVLFPSNWAHRAEAPNAFTNSLRTSLAFSYCSPNLIDIFEGDDPLMKFL